MTGVHQSFDDVTFIPGTRAKRDGFRKHARCGSGGEGCTVKNVSSEESAGRAFSGEISIFRDAVSNVVFR